MSNDRGFVTKGTPEYFAERERRMQGHIDEAKKNIDAIETKVRAEIAEINVQRDRLREHLAGFIDARNQLATHRNKTVDLIAQLNAVVTICDADLPVLDSMLDELEGETIAADRKLEETEKGKARQLNKHVRKKTRYELRKTRLDLRKRLLGVTEAEQIANEAMKIAEDEAIATDLEGGPQGVL